MTLTEHFIKENIWIDFGSEFLYGSDLVSETEPVQFQTVTFALLDTNGLLRIADSIRNDLGYKPMQPMGEYTDDTCDNDGWYDFYISINGYAESKVDSCIEFYVANSDSPDNEKRYTIELNEYEQKCIYNVLDEQLRKYQDLSCEELLVESEREMNEVF